MIRILLCDCVVQAALSHQQGHRRPHQKPEHLQRECHESQVCHVEKYREEQQPHQHEWRSLHQQQEYSRQARLPLEETLQTALPQFLQLSTVRNVLANTGAGSIVGIAASTIFVCVYASPREPINTREIGDIEKSPLFSFVLMDI